MRWLFTIFVVLAMSVSANAVTFLDQYGKSWDLILPPKEWANKPPNKEVRIYKTAPEDTREICTKAVGHFEEMGCALIWPGTCAIYVSKALPNRFIDAIISHEKAHCAGWPSDHPTGSSVPRLFPDP